MPSVAPRTAATPSSGPTASSTTRRCRPARWPSVVTRPRVMSSVGTALVALFLGLRLLHGTFPLGTALAILVLAPRSTCHCAGRVPSPTRAPKAGPPPPASSTCSTPPTRHRRRRTGQPPDRFRSGAAPRAPRRRDRPSRRTCPTGPRRGRPDHRCGRARRGRGRVRLGQVDAVERPDGLRRTGVGGHPRRRRVAVRVLLPRLASPRRLGPPAPCPRTGNPGGQPAPGKPRRHLRRVGSRTGPVRTGWPRGPATRGLATPVGEGGLTLSAGERQRIAIGRAVLRDVPIVLLDEPTAHLDSAREEELRGALTPWLEGRTVVMAAHRGGIVGRVDRTIALVAGQTVPDGMPAVGTPEHDPDRVHDPHGARTGVTR